MDRVVQPGRVGTPSQALARFAFQTAGSEARANSLGCGQEDFAELVECGRARFHGTAADYEQLPDRFHDAGGVFGSRGALAGQDLAGGRFGVDGVGLTSPGLGMDVGPIDFDDGDAAGLQVPGKPGSIGS
ncbi:hypothetical protein GCM10027597_10150 [Saccharopolyspora tripterygii]|jgi:hypothetical protein